MSLDNETDSSEEIFFKIKKEIVETSKEIETSISKIYAQEEILKAKKHIDFFNYNYEWLYSKFKTDSSLNKIEYPIIVDSEWKKANIQNLKSLELSNSIFLSEEEINYTICNNEVRTNVLLKNESSFWIFLRTKEYFSKENAIIIYNKESNSQNVHISLGKFYLNSNGNLLFKTFIKQQLILSKTNEINEKSRIYENNDTVNLNIKICDGGNENISVYTYMNENKEDNLVKGNFFIPVYGEYKIMFAGKGTQCKLIRFSCDLLYKNEYAPPNYSNDIKGCNCYSIM